MNAIDLKSAVVIFPWEESVRTISFIPCDNSSVAVLASLIEDKGATIISVEGFSVEEMDFLSSCQGMKQFFSTLG